MYIYKGGNRTCLCRLQRYFLQGLPLVLITLEICNSDAVIRSDDHPEKSICDLTIFYPNKSAYDLIAPQEDLLDAANAVIHSDE